MIFRITGGLSIGLAMVISPVCIAEVAPRRIRGALVTLNQIIIVLGALIALIISWMLAKWTAHTVSWRLMFASVILPVIGLLTGLAFIPESPRWLAKMRRGSEALQVLTRINGAEVAQSEVQEINEAIKLEEESRAVSYHELLHPGVRAAMVIAIGLAVLQQISGGMPLAMYAPIIFQRAGFAEATQAIALTSFIYVWSMGCVFIVLWAVERFGRRPMLLLGMTGMALGHLALALCFQLGKTGLYVPIILTLTLGMSNLSISPLAWVVLAEIFPTRIRGRAMGVATFALYVCMYLMNQMFHPVKEYFDTHVGSPAGLFIILAVICLGGVGFIAKMVPETKGKSLEEISAHWLKRSA